MDRQKEIEYLRRYKELLTDLFIRAMEDIDRRIAKLRDGEGR